MYAIGNQAYTNMQLMTKKNCANPDIVQIQIQVGQISELSKYCNRANNAWSLLNLNLDLTLQGCFLLIVHLTQLCFSPSTR